jgi:hypothetical protein
MLMLIIVLLSGLCFMFYHNVVASDYCESIGYDGYDGGFPSFRCYNDVSHKSGVGTVREYTGMIDFKEVGE